MEITLTEILLRNRTMFKDVVSRQGAVFAPLDLSPENHLLTAEVFESTDSFSNFINETLSEANADFLFGGYGEHREIYRRSNIFDDDKNSMSKEEPRNIHLGIDIWGKAGTEVAAPFDGSIHSFAFNDHFGDYGATIILQHNIDGALFHTLYGHLSLPDLDNIYVGKQISRGQVFCHFGLPFENGHWPPHLHFQVIENLQGMAGDYPGVCKTSEKQQYLSNCPDANFMLNLF